ncbi:MAG: methyltransferase [Clostridia bacterium]|nr:methyltransferase [Clostridia bacterium]
MVGENISLQPLGGGAEIYVSKNHTFGTDAVLLSNFAKPRRSERAVDLGTGCGIIPALWMRDNSVAKAFGLEISKEAVALAEQTISYNGWQNKMSVINGDIRNPFLHLPKGEFNLVTCNPPYKASGAGLLSATSADKTARHETMCDLRDVISAAAGLLTFGGRLAICQRPERLGEIISLMAEHKIEPKELRLVCKTEGCEPWLVLVKGRLGGGKGMRILPNLNIYKQDGELSNEMLEIYGPYKLEYK